MEQINGLFTVQQIAKAAQRSIGSTQYRLEKLGIQPRNRIGAVRLYSQADLDAVVGRRDERLKNK